MSQETKKIAKFALFGAIGFGVGALFLLTMGITGGAALGLALKNRRKVIVLALVGGIGFLFGLWVGVYVWEQAVALWEPFKTVWGYAIYGGTIGAIEGAALGLVMGGRRKIIVLAIAGALGFGIGIIIAPSTPFIAYIQWIIWGIIGGASLGAALGYLEKGEPANQSTSSDS